MDREALQNLTVESFEILAPAEGKKRRRFSMLANTGAPVQRMFGQAVFDLGAIDMAKKIPILMDHDPTKRVGFADKAEVTDEGLRLSGFLLGNAAGKQFAEESDEGFPFQASIGLRVSQWLEVEAGDTIKMNGREIPGPVSAAKKSRLLETSVLMAGADHQTHAVALAATQKEAPMSPEAFQKAHPEAVAAWQEAAAKDARSATRDELGTYLAAFPGREPFATARFVAGESLLEAKAALADVLQGELDTALAAPPPPPNPDAATLQALAAKAPGVGFDGATQESGAPKAPSVETLWADPQIQAEFGGSKAQFMQVARRGLLKELNG